MSKKQQELLDDAYKNYEKIINDGIQNPNDIKWNITEPKNPKLYPLTKEEFIDRIKTNSEFSERWGLMIKERELSLEERCDEYIKINPQETNDGVLNYKWIGDNLCTHEDYNKWNIPTKLNTIKYNDKTIESYE